MPGLARNAPYLTQACYIRELVPLHVIATLSEVDGDAEMKGLCREVTQAMLRLRDKLAGRPVRPNMNSAALGWSYSYYRASLYLDGERFAIVTPDGRNALSKRNAALLLEALNRKPHNGMDEGRRTQKIETTTDAL